MLNTTNPPHTQICRISLSGLMACCRHEASWPQGSRRSRVALLRPLLRPAPESLPLHDVPKLAQVGLGDGVVGLELQRAQVVGLRFGELTVEVEDGAEVHQSGRVLGRGKDKEGKRVKTEGQDAQWCLNSSQNLEGPTLYPLSDL